MKIIKPTEIDKNIIDMISNEWMLITAGNEKGYNMMTASWGGMGEMWGKDVALCVVRPQRHTLKFLDSTERFTLSFYGNDKKIHQVCGRMSGKDCNKTELTGLVPSFIDGTVTFEQANTTLVCRKLYRSQIKPEDFIDKTLLANYPDDDFHYVFVGEIEKVIVK